MTFEYYTHIKLVYSIKRDFLVPVKTSFRVLMFLGLILFLTDCSVEKNTGSTRFYHGITSRYNIYFNGYESFKAGLNRIYTGYTDDYTELLKVFEHSDPSTVSLCYSNMERAIQKASLIISQKSITARPDIRTGDTPSEKERVMLERKEYNDWVDDSYLLVGKARFYMHEFNEASSVFSYCITAANDPDIKTEATIWLARIGNETGQYNESLRILRETDMAALTGKSLKAMYHTTMADLLIRQKRYSEAVEPLNESLKYVSGKRPRYRFTYLLAQLHEQAGNSAKAISLYRQVARMNVPYEVEFNARINIAGVFDVNSGNPREMRKELTKMLRDSKNNEYQDQIHYALGNLSMKEGNVTEALESYRKSASVPSRNQNQKGRSYLALAQYYYNVPDWLRAGNYYDSAAYFLDQKYPDYQLIRVKSQDLHELTIHLNTIIREDSLQRVASMSPAERNTIISGIINKIISDERAGTTSQYTDRYNLGQYYENERRFQGNIEQEGKWYFYNQAALTFGRTEFRRRYGERRLEDNWRRANKARVTFQTASGQGDVASNGNDSTASVADYKTLQFYLSDLPLNDSLLSLSNRKIASAYLSAGKTFSERIENQPYAVESFEKLMNRYPSSELVPEALYYTYRVYRDKENDNQKSEIYRQRLIINHPESEFAMILSDPDYFTKKLAAQRRVEQLYQEAYNQYIGENFTTAITLSNNAIMEFGEDDLAPKFHLLRAFSTGRISDERTFREELSALIKKYPGTEETKRAEEIIASIDQQIPELKVEEEKVIAAELYTAGPGSRFFFTIIIMDPTFNINQASFDVISYNIDNYTDRNYRTEGTLTDNRYYLITVSGFRDNDAAWEYYKASSSVPFIRNPSGARVLTFLINEENLKVLETDRNPERYFIFFNENYLNSQTK